jgi:hypothetical protein
MEAAFKNNSISTLPIGYSKFLRLLSCFTSSHVLLIWFQYTILQVAVLYLLFTIKYLFSPGKWVIVILFGISILNTLLLYISNFVTSDALFTALSLGWFSQLLWMHYQPTRKLLIMHAVVLLFAFMVGNHALYYPVISILVILFICERTSTKLVGIAAIVLMLGCFIGKTLYSYKRTTGQTQFSAFSSWQLAANALYGYSHAPNISINKVPAQFRALHTIVNTHNDSIKKTWLGPHENLGIYYLWNEKTPLNLYMKQHWHKDSITGKIKRWVSMGPLYADYGKYLIKQYPIAYWKHFLLPNLVKYYIPETEYMGNYNMGRDSVDAIAVTWFLLKSNKVHNRFRNNQIQTPEYFPIAFAICNVVFVICFLAFYLLNGFIRSSHLTAKLLRVTSIILICNMGFSVQVSPIVLSYQLFPMIVTIIFAILLLNFIIQESRLTNPNKISNENNQIIQPNVDTNALKEYIN